MYVFVVCICWSISLSVRPSICQSIYLFIYLCVYIYIYIYIYIYTHISACVCLCVIKFIKNVKIEEERGIRQETSHWSDWCQRQKYYCSLCWLTGVTEGSECDRKSSLGSFSVTVTLVLWQSYRQHCSIRAALMPLTAPYSVEKMPSLEWEKKKKL